MRTPARTRLKRNTWCGPYAIAVILGIDYDQAYELCRKRLKRRRVTGMWGSWIKHVLAPFRIKLSFEGPYRHARLKRPHEARVTLLRLPDFLKPNRLYVVAVTGHYVVVDTSDWTVIDNRGEWRPIAHHRSALQRVMTVAEVKGPAQRPACSR